MFGMGTGEFIMDCSSDSLRGWDGLAIGWCGAWGLSVGLGTARVGIAAGMEGCETAWLPMDGLLTSGLLLAGWDDGRRSLIV